MRFNLSAYMLVAKHTFDEYVAYRLNFAMWRVRGILQLLTTYFLWFLVMPQNGKLFGYTTVTMLTYVVLSNLFSSIVLSSLSGEVGDEINKGELSNYLVKPINYFLYWFFRDIGDKIMNISFAIPELILVLIILRPPFFFQSNIATLSAVIISLVGGVLIYFLINLLIGTLGFWSSEVWAPRFILFTTLTFFSGGIFPLDILPKQLYQIFQLLPFTYLLFFPLKIYLGQLTSMQIIQGISISFGWILFLFFVVQFFWRRGLRVYTAQGK
jgi:ABC-2 type transport system permease protein